MKNNKTIEIYRVDKYDLETFVICFYEKRDNLDITDINIKRNVISITLSFKKEKDRDNYINTILKEFGNIETYKNPRDNNIYKYSLKFSISTYNYFIGLMNE